MKKKSFLHRAIPAFTLAEVLIVLGIIGIIAEMTIPSLVENTQKQELVVSLQKMYSVLSQAVMLWKTDIGCYNDAYTCLVEQGASDNQCSSFDGIAKRLAIVDSYTGDPKSTTNFGWLSNSSKLYNGIVAISSSWQGLSNNSYGCKYLLKDGSVIALDPDPDGFEVHVDVNGQKSPNRVGKDIYLFYIGKAPGVDVHPDLFWAGYAETGLCQYCTSACIAGVTDPSGIGATPTSYVLLNKKIPEYYK